VDSDDRNDVPFEKYQRHNDLPYRGDQLAPVVDSSGAFWCLDEIIGTSIIPIKGINTPRLAPGCLETELLLAYGFPISSQPEYDSFVNIIKRATIEWNISNKKDGTPWWQPNEVSKMDKFIYGSLKHGFIFCGREPLLPEEPAVIRNIRIAMR